MSVTHLATDSFLSSIHILVPSRHSVSCSIYNSRMIFFFQISDISFIFPLFLYAFPIPFCLFSQIISHFLQFLLLDLFIYFISMYMHVLLIIIAYFIYLHFKCYPHSYFPFKPPQHNPLPSDFMRVYAHRCTHSHFTALSFS